MKSSVDCAQPDKEVVTTRVIPSLKPGISGTLMVDMTRYFARKNIAAQEVQEYTKNMLQQELNDATSDVSTGLLWREIKNALSTLCNQDNPTERDLAVALIAPKNTPEIPHVITTLNNSFGELLKNSIDAKIQQYMRNQVDKSGLIILEVEVTIVIDGENLHLTIVDNAGGFPELLKNYFPEYVINQLFVDHKLESNKNRNEQLGGAGLGLRQLCCMLIKGYELDHSTRRHPTRLYDVIPGTTTIKLSNEIHSHSAKISITSPLKGFSTIDRDPKPMLRESPLVPAAKLTIEIPRPKSHGHDLIFMDTAPTRENLKPGYNNAYVMAWTDPVSLYYVDKQRADAQIYQINIKPKTIETLIQRNFPTPPECDYCVPYDMIEMTLNVFSMFAKVTQYPDILLFNPVKAAAGLCIQSVAAAKETVNLGTVALSSESDSKNFTGTFFGKRKPKELESTLLPSITKPEPDVFFTPKQIVKRTKQNHEADQLPPSGSGPTLRPLR